MSTIEELTHEYLKLQCQLRALAMRMGTIEQELESRFPARLTHEILRTVAGEVHRHVENVLIIPRRYERQVRKILGDQFNDLVLESDRHPSPRLRSMLFDGDSPVGMALRQYVEVNQTVRISVLLPVSDSAITSNGKIVEVNNGKDNL